MYFNYEIKVPASQVIKNCNSETYDWKSKYSFYNVARKFHELMREKLKICGVNVHWGLQAYFGELFANAYDAYLKKAESSNQPLIIKMIIKQRNNYCIVKISDNGTGFIYSESITFNQDILIKPSKNPNYFSREAILGSNKNPDHYIGGSFIGLANFEQSLSHNKATLFFKNRKTGGASIYVAFPKLQEAQEESNNQSPTRVCTLI